MPKISARTLWNTATGLAALAVVLVLVNAVLILGNESRQADVNQRQQFINQSVQLARIYQTLVSLLAETAVKTNDNDLRTLLASSGITVKVNPGGQVAPSSQPAAPATGK